MVSELYKNDHIDKPDWLLQHDHLSNIPDTKSWVSYPYDNNFDEAELKKQYNKFDYEVFFLPLGNYEYTSSHNDSYIINHLFTFKILILEKNYEYEKILMGCQKLQHYYCDYFSKVNYIHDVLIQQLNQYSPEIKNAYLGAVHALDHDEYPDRLSQFAYSLREVLDLLSKYNLPDTHRLKPMSVQKRVNHYKDVIQPNYEIDEYMKKFTQLTHAQVCLNQYVHHNKLLDQDNAHNLLCYIRNLLHSIVIPKGYI